MQIIKVVGENEESNFHRKRHPFYMSYCYMLFDSAVRSNTHEYTDVATHVMISGGSICNGDDNVYAIISNLGEHPNRYYCNEIGPLIAIAKAIRIGGI